MNSKTDIIVKNLRQTLVRMKLVLDAIDEAVVWTDAMGRITWYNNAFQNLIKHHSEKLLLGIELESKLRLFQDNKEVDISLYPHYQAVKLEQNYHATYEFAHEGKTEPLKITSCYMTFENGEKYVINIISKHSLVNLDKQEPASLASQKIATLSKTISDIVHELNQVLLVIQHNMQAWKAVSINQLSQQNFDEIIASTVAQVDKANELINSLLVYAARG